MANRVIIFQSKKDFDLFMKSRARLTATSLTEELYRKCSDRQLLTEYVSDMDYDRDEARKKALERLKDYAITRDANAAVLERVEQDSEISIRLSRILRFRDHVCTVYFRLYNIDGGENF